MPLIASGLSSALAAVAESPPPSSAQCAQAWANAVQSYAAAVIPPSAAVAAAGTALAAALVAAFAAPAAAPGMETGFATFGAAVGAGMAPAFVAVPPVVPVGFATQFAGPKPETHEAAGDAISGIIDAWMRTGTATPAAGGSPAPWS